MPPCKCAACLAAYGIRPSTFPAGLTFCRRRCTARKTTSVCHYFHTMGIPLLRGRAFSDADRPHAQPVAILNQAFAERLFGKQDPVGHFIGYQAAPGDHVFQIVGEVGNAQVDGLRRPAPPVAYFSLEQGTAPAGTIEVSALGSPATIAADIRRSLQSVDPNLPISEIVPLDTEFDDGLSTEKLLARLTAAFAGMTLALAAIGFYGLLSFQVVRRTSEIGIRIAMGATRGQVIGLFLLQTATILISGILPGIVLTVLGWPKCANPALRCSRDGSLGLRGRQLRADCRRHTGDAHPSTEGVGPRSHPDLARGMNREAAG